MLELYRGAGRIQEHRASKTNPLLKIKGHTPTPHVCSRDLLFAPRSGVNKKSYKKRQYLSHKGQEKNRRKIAKFYLER